MIKFTKNELNYCIKRFKKVVNDRELKNQDKDYQIYLQNLGDTLDDAAEVLKMNLNLNKVNNDKELNKKVLDTIYWVDCFWTWGDCETDEDLKEILGDEKDEFYSIYGKMINEE